MPPSPGALVISELMVAVDGDDEGREWFEVHNPSAASISLAGLRLVDESSGIDHVIADATDRPALVIEPGGYAVFAQGLLALPLAGGADVYHYGDGLAFDNGGDGLWLVYEDTLIDRVTYDDTAAWPSREGRSISLAPVRLDATANDDGLNWCAGREEFLDASGRRGTPGRANDACPFTDEVGLPERGDLLITELMIDPEGDDEGAEWIEVLNTSSRTVRIDGLKLSDEAASDRISNTDAALAPGGYLVLAHAEDVADRVGSDVLVHTYDRDLRMGNSADRVRLEVDGELIAEQAYDAGQGWFLREGSSFQLSSDAMSALAARLRLNWCANGAAADGTPGAPNTECPRDDAPVPAAAEIVISEFYANAPGDDSDAAEWIEVHNPTNGPLRLNGVILSAGDDGHRIDLPGLEIEAGGYALLASREQLTQPDGMLADYVWSDIRLGNDAEVVRLDTDEGVLIDEVGYDRDALWPIRSGYSATAHPTEVTAEGNDDPLAWCLGRFIEADAPSRATPRAANAECPMFDPDSPITDDLSVYDQDEDDPIVIDIELDPVDLDLLEQVTSDANDIGAVPAIAYLPGEDAAEATIEVRGQTSRLTAQKSWKLELADGTFRGQSVLHLSKHPFDLTRLRNALAFRLLRGVDHLPSMRTQLVHLFINGEDYGLFSQAEHMSGRYLRARGLDDRGFVFKANYFAFRAPTADELANGRLAGIEAKTRDDHGGVLAMLDALHDPALAVDDVVADHFNRDNLLTFFAVAYLTMNLDTISQNFFLYATPHEPARFYFLPWDFDGAFDWYSQGVGSELEIWRGGLSNWWDMPLFSKFLSSPQNLADLLARIDDLAAGPLAQAQVSAHIDVLDPIVGPFVARSPDSDSGNLPAGDRAVEVQRVEHAIEARAADAATSADRPMPVYATTFMLDTDVRRWSWSDIFDPQGDPSTAELVIIDGPCDDDPVGCLDESFVIHRAAGLTGRTLDQSMAALALAPGSYYWLVYVHDAQGNTNTNFYFRTPKSFVVE